MKHLLRSLFLFLLLTLCATSLNAQRQLPARQAKPHVPALRAIISEQPDGRVIDNMNRSAQGYYMENDYAWEGNLSGGLGKLVVAENGDVYVYEPFSQVNIGAWLKLEKGVGDTLICRMPQEMFYDYYTENEASQNFGIDHDTIVVLEAHRMVYGEDENGSWYFDDKSGPTDVKFVFRNDTLRSLDEKEVLIGLADKAGNWQGYGDYRIVFKPIQEQPVQAPDADWQDYMMDWVTNSEFDNRLVRLAIDGNDVYLDNLYDGTPGGVVHGTLDGEGIVSFPTHQYLGVDENYQRHIFFYAGNTYRLNDRWGESLDIFGHGDGSPIRLRLNAETRELTAVKDSTNFLVNAGDDIVYFYACYTHPHLVPFADEALTPAMPVINYDNYVIWDPDYECGHIDFVLPKRSVDGRYLDASKLYYNIYFDEERLTLASPEYEYIYDALTDIPYAFTDDYDIILRDGGDRSFYFYKQDFTTIAVESVYMGGGTVTRSQKAYLNTEDVAIRQVEADERGLHKVYDLQGRRVQQPRSGLYIRDGRKLIY